MCKVTMLVIVFLLGAVKFVNAQTVPPSGYKLVYSTIPKSTSDIANGYPKSASASASWFYNVEQCCGGDPLRPLAAYDSNFPDGTANSAYPWSFLTNASGTPIGFATNLQMHAKTTNASDGFWTSGILTSVDSAHSTGHSWVYGYYEWDAKMPGPKVGTWPGLYLKSLDQTNSGFEIDIMEHYSYWPTAYSIHVTDWTTGTNVYACNTDAGVDLSSGYHKYGMLWTATTMTFYFDRKAVSCLPYGINDSIFSKPAYAIMDLGVGQGSGPNDPGNPSTLPSSNQLRITGFHVWQQ